MTEPVRVVMVTGTDTGVGKTRVARGILRAIARRGLTVAPLKLIETGCPARSAGLHPEDGAALAHAAGLDDQLAIVAPERFPLPASPAVAAAEQHRTLRFDPLIEHVHHTARISHRVLLEGAGGLLVPIGPDGTFAELAQRLAASVVLVVRDALGTINHTLLTVEALARRALPLRAIVLQPVGLERSPLDHTRQLRGLLPGTPIHGPLPWSPGATDDALADDLEAAGLDPIALYES